MNINNENLRNVAQAALEIMEGKIKHPNQQKLDVHEPEKDELTADDFKKLRAMKKEETEQVDEAMQKSDVPAYLRKQKGEKPLSVADVKGPRPDSISSKEGLAKLRNEETIEEADIEKTATGMKVYGSSYGNSVRARREQVKKSIDTAKGPKMKDIESIEAEKKKKKKFSEMVETYVQSGIQGLFEGWKKVKEEATNDEFKSELDKQQAKADGKAPQADVAKAAVQAVQQEAIETTHEYHLRHAAMYKKKGDERNAKYHYDRAHEWQIKANHDDTKRAEAELDRKYRSEEVEQIDEISLQTMKSAKEKLGDKAFQAHMDDNKYAAQHYAGRAMNMKKKIAQKELQVAKEEVEQVEERTLSEPEMKKREEVVKSMKKGIQGFKDRYGADAKSVMYATATKIAKKD